jgi:two-component system sensor histidine kinase YesM
MSVTGTISRLLTSIVALTLLFCLLLAGAYTRIITRPLRELGSSMVSLSQENFEVQVSIRGKDEIAKLGERFNEMDRQLYTLYRENYVGQIKLKQAQIENLQTQLNPHFMYNTLDTIYWMSELNRNKDASYMISNLTKMLRMTLRNSSDDISLLQDELEAISYYININRIRKGDKIDFVLNCPDELHHCLTMKFVIQPLLENSLQHGLKNSKEGHVIVNVSDDEDVLIIDVLNDGKLINPDEINELISQPSDSMRGFSIRNINERLILKYGNEYKLQYFCAGDFTVFRIRQPLSYLESEDQS